MLFRVEFSVYIWAIMKNLIHKNIYFYVHNHATFFISLRKSSLKLLNLTLLRIIWGETVAILINVFIYEAINQK